MFPANSTHAFSGDRTVKPNGRRQEDAATLRCVRCGERQSKMAGAGNQDLLPARFGAKCNEERGKR